MLRIFSFFPKVTESYISPSEVHITIKFSPQQQPISLLADKFSLLLSHLIGCCGSATDRNLTARCRESLLKYYY